MHENGRTGPPDRDNGTRTMPRIAAGDGEPVALMDVVREVVERLPPPDETPSWEPPREPSPLERFLAQLGPRHVDATLENFDPPNDWATLALKAIREYAANLRERIEQGQGVVLYGPAGTGKDHLLVALGKLAAASGLGIKRVCGPELFRLMRDAMSAGEESAKIDSLKHWPILILSDPLPPVGSLTPYQASILYELIDWRWTRQRVTWASLNVASSQEADERLGATIVDRLQDRALVIACDWPSHRKAKQVIKLHGR